MYGCRLRLQLGDRKKGPPRLSEQVGISTRCAMHNHRHPICARLEQVSWPVEESDIVVRGAIELVPESQDLPFIERPEGHEGSRRLE